MKYIIILLLAALTSSCSSLADLYKTVDDVATDDAIQIVVSREAIQNDRDVIITIDIKNQQMKEASNATPER